MAVTIIVAIVAVVIVASAAVVVVSTAAAALPPRVVRGRRRRRGRVRAAAEVARVRAGGAARVRVAAAADGSEVGDCVLPQRHCLHRMWPWTGPWGAVKQQAGHAVWLADNKVLLICGETSAIG